ncbi:MAG: two-component sensor histidine kinase [Ahrensia sp.]|jgi:signal transduction histidine kinase|nr:two-component sensor histidine kinase [Ahrensia sp.]
MSLFPRLRRLPLTVRVPAIVAVLMVAISAVISERVLDRLSATQEIYLQGLASAYLDGVVAAITPSVLREDSWEVFDGIERMKPTADDILPIETVVTGENRIVLASSNPLARETLRPLDTEFIANFNGADVTIDPDTRSGYIRRDITYQDTPIGAVYAVFDVTSLLEERRQILATLLATNALITAFLGLIGFITVRRMIRPMQVLETHMVEAAGGSATLIAESEFPATNNEAANVYRAYNALVNSETERQALASQLAEEEKLASLGRLASGMAHEINNPLGGLMNAVDTLRLHGERRSVRETSIELIQRGLHGIREVVEAALATYRPERLSRPLEESDFADLRLLVRPELRRRQQRLDYRMEGTLAGEQEWPAGPIRQAVLNLLLNAAAATPDGGRISLYIIATRSALEITISDQGSGLPDTAKAILQHDSKTVPKEGQGLGLWIVREIANDLGAVIAIFGGPNEDLAIRLSIPRRKNEVSDAA